MYILSPQQTASADKTTIKNKGITYVDLMETAATSCFQWLHNKLQGEKRNIHIFCGIGNNGGDGLVIARHLHKHNYRVNCYVVNFSDKRTDEFIVNYKRLTEIGLTPIKLNNENNFPEIEANDLVVDAIFGNGLTRNPEGFTKKLIQYLNHKKVFVLAIDIPSGLFGNKSVTDAASVLKSSHILTFQTPKMAFLLPENKDFVYTWEVIDIGLDQNFIESLHPKTHYTTLADIIPLYKTRNKWDHKGTYGHSLMIGGSYGKMGAITLASIAALKIGSGLVSAYIPKCGYAILQVSVPEVMVEVDTDDELTYFNFKTNPSVIGIGPGMGTAEKTAQGFENFIKDNKLPLVIDADAINLLSKNQLLLNYLPKNTVLTPHPKELERLIGAWKNDYEKLEKVSEFSKKHSVIVVIKGAHTVVIQDDERHFNSTGNQALATGGSGDVLTGMITGLIAQGYGPVNAALLGVYLHGKTAEIALPVTGYETFSATTIFDYLATAILEVASKKEA
jgi:ADP-dependent NAD(P)H-hydrate dehydratase / NAD(P)H-hydrate epimerase